ncbi:nuclear transport factor 2 family protein [Rhodospirillum sp. A1_3_36]|uniref:nuclear transport factor 2 family protein n=1 Tax=Rhodospirillum sp. A1_3_36 TaxID=3391666 RepID=UPI0039A49D68
MRDLIHGARVNRRQCMGGLAMSITAGAMASGSAATALAGEGGAEVDAERTEEVFNHHLGAFAEGLDAIMADYTEESVLMTPMDTLRGLDAIRGFFKAFLDGATPEFWAAFKVNVQVVEGEIAYLVWSSLPSVPLATDTLFVRDGKIAVQTFTPMVPT